MDVAGKRVLVTGGSRGIGRQIVLDFARAGAQVLTCYRSEGEAVDSLVAALKETGGDHHAVRADVGTPDGIAALAEAAKLHLGRVDVLVNNAGTITHIPFQELTLDGFRAVIDSNLTGSAFVTQALLPLMGGGGSVVNLGSKAAVAGVPLRAHYTASKSGAVGLTRALAKELGPKGIRVNLVAPGPIETEAPTPKAVVARYTQMIPLGRLGRTAEISSVVRFLASDAASFVNGESINVDGGI